MRLPLLILLCLLYLSLSTGCDSKKKYTAPDAPSVTTHIDVATEPVGVGLGVIGGGIVVAAWICTVLGGRRDD